MSRSESFLKCLGNGRSIYELELEDELNEEDDDEDLDYLD